MTKKDRRPPLGGITSQDDDLDRIREFGLSRGFLPTELSDAAPLPQASPSRTAAPSPPPAPALPRPAPTKPWQAMFPDYLIDELRQAAAHEGTAQKVVVMRALRAAGFHVNDIDLQDLRRR